MAPRLLNRSIEIASHPAAVRESPAPVGAPPVDGLRHARERLQQSRAEIRGLLSERDSAQAEERSRIARELHDSLQQTLAAARFDLTQAIRLLETGASAERIAALLAKADGHLVETMASTRRIVSDLQPQVLELLGLVPAIGRLAAGFTARTRVSCRVVAPVPAAISMHADVTPRVAHCIYRITQEALNNVEKHANARNVRIDVDASVAGLLRVVIADDGRGMEAGARDRPHAFGLRGARERAREAGGRLRVTSSPGAGTRVELRLARGQAAAPRGSDGGRASSGGAEPCDPGAAWPGEAAGREGPDGAALQAVVEGVGVPAAILDASGVIIAMNRAWCDLEPCAAARGTLRCGAAEAWDALCAAALRDGRAGVSHDCDEFIRVLDGRQPVGAGLRNCRTADRARQCLVQAIRLHDGTTLVTRSAMTG